MIIRKELLQAFLDKYGITAAMLAREIGTDKREIQTLLDGGAVNEATARKFIYYFGADEAVKMIDWAALGKEIPNIGKGVKMANETFVKVAYIGLKQPDGAMMINVPLYVKVSELNKSGMTDTQEKVISRITEIMIKRYEKQLSEYFASLKEKSKKEEL